jgi:CheB methylesterase
MSASDAQGARRTKVIAFVASAGGVDALSGGLRLVPKDLPAAVVVALHLGGQGSALVEIVAPRISLPVLWAHVGGAIAERSVAWDSGEPIPGTPFRHLVKAADTEGRFSCQSVGSSGPTTTPDPATYAQVILTSITERQRWRAQYEAAQQQAADAAEAVDNCFTVVVSRSGRQHGVPDKGKHCRGYRI